MTTIIYSLTLIICALVLGYGLQRLDRSGRVNLPVDILNLRRLLQKFALLYLMPIAFLGAFWVVSFNDARVAWLPVIGLVAILSGGILGLLVARLFKVKREQTGVMFISGMITNLGAIGSLVCFLFLGEAGFALVALYKMLEEMCYYMVGFPVARYYGHGEIDRQISARQRLVGIFRDPFVATILTALAAGLALNLVGIDRPLMMEKITAFIVPIGTFLMIFSIGLGMRFSSVRKHLDKCLVISAIKFIAIPVIACSLAYLANLHEIAGGLPFMVVVICSSMPVGFNALVAASIFNLDLELANSLWLVSTGLLILIIPWLFFLLQHLS